jgi:exopolyphosphatase / guanosine-5'-triphosphate,3'-diphosphate pyrophosphatase
MRMSRYAAIDIGSNSIRMLAAEFQPGEPMKVLTASRQVVRLGASVFKYGKLSPESIEFALSVLTGMAQEYRLAEVIAVRAVGTAALRDASNREEFLTRAHAVLGTPVEVISGLEEARLIHLGVTNAWPNAGHRIMITDIGGGSAEMIVSEAGRIVEAYSKPLGAVRLTELFLKSDPADPREIERMRRYIQERIEGAATRFAQSKIDRMIATSATAAATVCAVNRVRRTKRDEADRRPATAAQIRQLFQEISTRDLSGRQKITGIGPKRAEIIVAGVAVLNEVVERFKFSRLYYSNAGVREGIVADLAYRKVGHEHARLDADQRRVVAELGRRYAQSAPHVRKVAHLASMLYAGLQPLHQLPPATGRLLEASAYLYNIGHYVNELRHHRHSLYLVANSDLPGFSDAERMLIANLCRYHRKSMPGPSHEVYQQLDPEARRTVLLLAPLLRLAVALDQSQEQKIERLETFIRDREVAIEVHSAFDTDIEQWQAQQVAGVFTEVYGRSLEVRAAR